MPSSVLTRFLRQGLERGMCPLCRALHKLEREYMWHFFEERGTHLDVLDQLSAARGLCALHVDQLRQIEVEDTKSTIGISDIYVYTLQGLARDLERLVSDEAPREGKPRRRLGFRRDAEAPEAQPARALSVAQCPACAHLEQEMAKQARYVVESADERPGFREQLRASAGLCVEHFRLVWETCRTADQRAFFVEVELRAVGSLLAELQEHLRKQRAEFQHEAPGPEADSWLRAVWLTVGWPRPRESAAVPERQQANQLSG